MAIMDGYLDGGCILVIPTTAVYIGHDRILSFHTRSHTYEVERVHPGGPRENLAFILLLFCKNMADGSGFSVPTAIWQLWTVIWMVGASW